MPRSFNVTLEEVRQAKGRCEAEILAALNKFHEDTGLRATDVEPVRELFIGADRPVVIHVQVKVEV